MLDYQSLIRFEDIDLDSPNLQGLDLLIGMRGHADAGHVVSQVRTELLDSLNPRLIASFDTDQLVNYRERRPQISFLGDHFAAYQPPRLELYLLTDGLDQDFFFLTGPEPDLAWERVSRAITALVEAFNIKLTVSFGAMPMPVPHTRPMGVTAHGNREDLVEGISSWAPTAELPASFVNLLEVRLSELGNDVAGYSMHVPHYLSEAEYPNVAVGALEYVGAAMELGLPTDRLREAGRRLESQIAEQVAENPDVQKMVENFETRFDQHVPETERRSLLVSVDAEVPDGEELANAVEAFLSGMDDQGGSAVTDS